MAIDYAKYLHEKTPNTPRPEIQQQLSAGHQYEKDKIIGGWYDNEHNRKMATTDELRNYYIYKQSGNTDHVGKYDPKYDDLQAYYGKDRSNYTPAQWDEFIAGKTKEDYGNQSEPEMTFTGGTGGRSSWNPNQRTALSYGEAADRAKQQLDPLYERALENVRKQRYQNELSAGEVSSARGLAHSGLAADQLNKIGIASQGQVADLDAQRASEIAAYAQRMMEFDQNIALQERAQNLSEYLGIEGLNLNRDQFDWSKHTDTRNFDYQKALNDRNFNYQTSRDQVADQRYDEEFAYQRTRDQIADQRYQQEYDEDVRRWGLDYALQKQVQLGNLSIAQAELALAQAREARLARGGGGYSSGGSSGLSSPLSSAYQQYQQTKSNTSKSPIDQYYEQMENVFKGSVVRKEPVVPIPSIGSNPNLSSYDRYLMMMQQYGLK